MKAISLILGAVIFTAPVFASQFSRCLEQYPDSNTAKCFDAANAKLDRVFADMDGGAKWQYLKTPAARDGYYAETDICFRIGSYEPEIAQCQNSN